MLRPEEVEMLVCGNPELDMDALRKVTVYNGYTKNDPPIRLVFVVCCFVGREKIKHFGKAIKV